MGAVVTSIYVAASSADVNSAERWIAALRDAGHRVTSTWPEVIAYARGRSIVSSGDTKQSIFCALGVELADDADAFAWICRATP